MRRSIFDTWHRGYFLDSHGVVRPAQVVIDDMLPTLDWHPRAEASAPRYESPAWLVTRQTGRTFLEAK